MSVPIYTNASGNPSFRVSSGKSINMGKKLEYAIRESAALLNRIGHLHPELRVPDSCTTPVMTAFQALYEQNKARIAMSLSNEEMLFASMEKEEEAEALRQQERQASKKERKAADVRRKEKAAEKAAERAEERERQKREEEECAFVAKWEPFIANANKYAVTNWDAYRAAEGKEKDKMRKKLYHRLDEYNKLTDAQKKLLDEGYYLKESLPLFLRTYRGYRQTEQDEKEAAKAARRPAERRSNATSEASEDSLPPMPDWLKVPSTPGSAGASSPAEPSPPAELRKSQKKKLRRQAAAAATAGEVTSLSLGHIANDTPNVSPEPSPPASEVSVDSSVVTTLTADAEGPLEPQPSSRGCGNGGRGGDAFRVHHQPSPPKEELPKIHKAVNLVPAAAAPPPKPECPDELTCSITLEPMLEAQTCVPCGHTFSKQGLQAHLMTQRMAKARFSCPHCREYVDPEKIIRALAIESMAARFV